MDDSEGFYWVARIRITKISIKYHLRFLYSIHLMLEPPLPPCTCQYTSKQCLCHQWRQNSASQHSLSRGWQLCLKMNQYPSSETPMAILFPNSMRNKTKPYSVGQPFRNPKPVVVHVPKSVKVSLFQVRSCKLFLQTVYTVSSNFSILAAGFQIYSMFSSDSDCNILEPTIICRYGDLHREPNDHVLLEKSSQ